MTSGLCRAKPSLRVPSSSSLFLEATQLETVRRVLAVLQDDPDTVEVQGAGIALRRERRPAISVVADTTQSPKTTVISRIAEARGRGAARHSKTGAFSAKFGPFRRGLAKGVTIPLAAIFAYFLSHHRK